MFQIDDLTVKNSKPSISTFKPMRIEKPLSPLVTLTLEDVGGGGSEFFESLSCQKAQNGHLVLNVVIDPSCFHILNRLLLRKSNNFLIMDAVTESVRADYTCKPPLHEISLTLKEARRLLFNLARKWRERDSHNAIEIFIFFWSLNPLIINNQIRDVLSFLYTTVRQSIIYKTTEFYLLQKGIVEDQVLKSLMALSHVVWDIQNTNENGCQDASINIIKEPNSGMGSL